jgi:hypothetical protein
LLAEQAGQAAIEIAPEFFEVGRALVAATALAATGLIAPAVVVERHEYSGYHVYMFWVVRKREAAREFSGCDRWQIMMSGCRLGQGSAQQ